MLFYEFQNSTKIVSGKNSIANIPAELGFFNSKRPLLISDAVLNKIGTVEKISKSLKDGNIEIGYTYTEVPQDSDLEVINKLCKIYKENNCDSIVAVGGGSVIDTAKGVRMLISQNVQDINDLMGNEILKYGIHVPFIVIPTTAGTGSEVTLVAVIEDKIKNVKMEFISYFLLPDVAILDPKMTVSLPKKATASTGMDALCHAIEAYSCIQKNPMSDSYAISAISLIRDNLLKAVENGNDEEARLNMANASLMSGVSFSNSMVGLVHAIGHSLGAICHIPHGDAISILLPYVMEYNLDKCEENYAKLLFFFGTEEEYMNTPKEKRAEKLIEKVRNMINDLHEKTGLPNKLEISDEEIEKVAKTAINDGAIIVSPKKADYEDIVEILRKAR